MDIRTMAARMGFEADFAAHLLPEDGVGLVVVGCSGLAAGLPLCQSPQLAGEVEVGNCCFCHSNVFLFHGAKIRTIFYPTMDETHFCS